MEWRILQARRNQDGASGVLQHPGVQRGRDPRAGKQSDPLHHDLAGARGLEREAGPNKEAEKQAAVFEQPVPGRDTWQTGARPLPSTPAYVLEPEERTGLKAPDAGPLPAEPESGCCPSWGILRLGEIRPQHLNYVYQQLSLPEAREDNEMAAARPALWQVAEARGDVGLRDGQSDGRRRQPGAPAPGRSRSSPPRPGASPRRWSCPTPCCLPTQREEKVPGSSRTITELPPGHLHRAGAGGKGDAHPPKPGPPGLARPSGRPSGPQLFPDGGGGERSCEALEAEPVKWRAAVHLLLVSGCRRGELLGLKWDHVNWESGQIHIDCTLLYAGDRGVYEGTPKTRDSVRTIKCRRRPWPCLDGVPPVAGGPGARSWGKSGRSPPTCSPGSGAAG